MIRSRKLKKNAKELYELTGLSLRKARKALQPEVIKKIEEKRKELKAKLREGNEQELEEAMKALETMRDTHLSDYKVNQTWETAKAILIAVLIAFFIRWLLIEPFRIPSGSMIPTLLVGDQLMVNKLVYGAQIPFTTKKLFTLRTPRRGEVIVFKFPHNPRDDYIKRVIGIPGDELMIRDGELYINGKHIEKEYIGSYDGPVDRGNCSSYALFVERIDGVSHNIIECDRVHFYQDFGPEVVPDGMLFMMGDNRDNSSDSRDWGFVPVENVKGKAMFIHLPLDPQRHYLPRWRRFFKWIR